SVVGNYGRADTRADVEALLIDDFFQNSFGVAVFQLRQVTISGIALEGRGVRSPQDICLDLSGLLLGCNTCVRITSSSAVDLNVNIWMRFHESRIDLIDLFLWLGGVHSDGHLLIA